MHKGQKDKVLNLCSKAAMTEVNPLTLPQHTFPLHTAKAGLDDWVRPPERWVLASRFILRQ